MRPGYGDGCLDVVAYEQVFGQWQQGQLYGCRHDIGDAKAAANLDKLAAADDNLFARGMGGKHQQHRGGIVVDHERVLGTGE